MPYDCCYFCRKSCKDKRVKECSAKEFSTNICVNTFNQY